jgi:GT2 family glycosyltransferase
MTVDADSIVSKNIFKEVLRLLDSDKYVGGGVIIFPERYSLGILLSGFILAWIALIFRIQCGAFFFKREYFEAIDGFNETILSAEDIDFAIRLKRYGKNINKKYSFLNLGYIVTSCRKFDHFGDWYFVRNYRETYKLLLGQGRDAADKIWYDFKR